VSGDLTQTSIADALTGRFGSPLRFHESIGSTNSDALAWAVEGAPEGALVVAEHQTNGRGRWGRSWVSEPGHLLQFSLVLRPKFSLDKMGLLTTAVGLATAEGVEDSAGIKTGIKWPNDVMVVERKLSGVLVETRMLDESVDAAIVGVGINVGWTESDVPANISERATSIAIWAEEPVPRPALLAAVLLRLETYYDELAAGRVEPILDGAADRSVVLGREVVARFIDGSFLIGRALSLTTTGALEIEVEGESRTLNVGEIEQLR
jgi:BirA family biotin operon repressor/biotin-[acetyl-CoA-carboxylase] ligase